MLFKKKTPNKASKSKKRGNKKAGSVDWGELLHISFNAVLPFVLVALINNDLTTIAVALVVISKWRMFAMRFNHLPANIRANLTDLIVKLSTLSFMVRVESLTVQIILAAWYAVWLLLVKPQTGRLWISIQAMASQMLGLTALMWGSDVLAEYQILIGVWIVIYATTFHFLSDYDEPLARVLAKIWAVVGVEMAWIFLHWNLVYFGVVPQFALILGAFSFIAADLYNSYMHSQLKPGKYRMYVLATVVILIVMIVSGKWNGPIV